MLALALCGMLVYSCKDDDDDDNSGNNGANAGKTADSIFVAKASMGNAAEIQIGSLASTHSNDSGIQWFGQMMVDDHTLAKANLTAIANYLNMYAPDAPDAAHAALLAQLTTLYGPTFDSVYIHNMVTDHQEMVTVFQDEINNGSNAQVTGFANTNLPTIQMHQHLADSLATYH